MTLGIRFRLKNSKLRCTGGAVRSSVEEGIRQDKPGFLNHTGYIQGIETNTIIGQLNQNFLVFCFLNF